MHPWNSVHPPVSPQLQRRKITSLYFLNLSYLCSPRNFSLRQSCDFFFYLFIYFFFYNIFDGASFINGPVKSRQGFALISGGVTPFTHSSLGLLHSVRRGSFIRVKFTDTSFIRRGFRGVPPLSYQNKSHSSPFSPEFVPPCESRPGTSLGSSRGILFHMYLSIIPFIWLSSIKNFIQVLHMSQLHPSTIH